MRRIFCIVLVIVMGIFAVSCQKSVSVESCIMNAETHVENASRKLDYYSLKSDFNDDVDVFCILMSVDKEKVTETVNDMSVKEEYKAALTTVAINNHDSNEEAIKKELHSVKSTIEALFEGTDVLVECGYVTLDGKVTWY